MQNIQFLKISISLLVLLLVIACGNENNSPTEEVKKTDTAALFELVPTEHSGLTFTNNIIENDSINYFRFMHLYMGAGVATGDINNDGLPDLFFNSNMEANQLYLNKGGLKFEDISQSAGINDAEGFTTGVTMADVNGDGWLDIYVCKSGWYEDPSMKQNLLFINNKNSTFTESAAQYGLNDIGNSIQSSFFDYDKDGDLDMFLINTPVYFQLTGSLMPLDEVHASQDLRQFRGYDKLYRNDGSTGFKDVTTESGILSDIGFGLSVLTCDFNQDGWTDIFIANDFMTPDYLYINQKNGTFLEQRNQYFKHTTFYSMGSDVGDINNDGLQDLFVLDMLPEDYKRSKVTMEMVDPEAFKQSVEWGYNHQYMHNMLHLNNGNSTFREVGQMAGITNTDWSWTALLSDFDNDGWTDIFISNGIQRDVTERDHKNKIAALKQEKGRGLRFSEVRDLIPSQKIPNYIFRNKGDLTFENVSEEWGVAIPSFSNGSVVADFDKDGDLDIICNNVKDAAFLYENKSNDLGNNYLRVQLRGNAIVNPQNAVVHLKFEDGSPNQSRELVTTRGYFSRSEEILHFGLGKKTAVSSLEVHWTDGKKSILNNVKSNQLLTINYASAQAANNSIAEQSTIFQEASNSILNPIFQHKENEFDDYKNQVLLPHSQSRNGGMIAVGDVNGDGAEDFFIGGANNQAGAIYTQKNGKFSISSTLENDKGHEDIGALFFDCDGDKDLDLYVVSGGTELPANYSYYQDRLYKNDGKGNFARDNDALPTLPASGSIVVPNDFDGDGDLDLFVGGRIIPDKYPFAPKSYLLKNNGGKFSRVTRDIAPQLHEIGMVTDAVWTDFNSDGKKDLIVVGEWMNIELFENQNGKFALVTPNYGLDKTRGWWNNIAENDFDGDGDMDYIVGNLGLNYKFHASEKKPFHVYCDDFDKNGTFDIVLAKNVADGFFPVRGRTCSSEQMPFIKDKFPTFNDYADADISAIYGAENLDAALHYEAYLFESVILKNNGGSFEILQLPLEAQISPINGILVHDFDSDGITDLLIAGNHFGAEVETTRADAGIGLFLKGNGSFDFQPVPLAESGFYVPHDAKCLKMISLEQNKTAILVGNNNNVMQIFTSNNRIVQ